MSNNIRTEEKYDSNGNIIEQRYYDEYGNLTITDEQGCAILRKEYDDNNRPIIISTYGINEELMESRDGIAVFKLYYDSQGNNTHIETYDSNNNLLTNAKNPSVTQKDKSNITSLIPLTTALKAFLKSIALETSDVNFVFDNKISASNIDLDKIQNMEGGFTFVKNFRHLVNVVGIISNTPLFGIKDVDNIIKSLRTDKIFMYNPIMMSNLITNKKNNEELVLFINNFNKIIFKSKDIVSDLLAKHYIKSKSSNSQILQETFQKKQIIKSPDKLSLERLKFLKDLQMSIFELCRLYTVSDILTKNKNVQAKTSTTKPSNKTINAVKSAFKKHEDELGL